MQVAAQLGMGQAPLLSSRAGVRRAPAATTTRRAMTSAAGRLRARPEDCVADACGPSSPCSTRAPASSARTGGAPSARCRCWPDQLRAAPAAEAARAAVAAAVGAALSWCGFPAQGRGAIEDGLVLGPDRRRRAERAHAADEQVGVRLDRVEVGHPISSVAHSCAEPSGGSMHVAQLTSVPPPSAEPARIATAEVRGRRHAVIEVQLVEGSLARLRACPPQPRTASLNDQHVTPGLGQTRRNDTTAGA